MNEYAVYILLCRDRSYYTGVTSELEERLQAHQRGDDPEAYTYPRRPLELVYAEYFGNIRDAIAAEKQIQGWSRKKKEALISGKVELLHELAMSSEKRARLSALKP